MSGFLSCAASSETDTSMAAFGLPGPCAAAGEMVRAKARASSARDMVPPVGYRQEKTTRTLACQRLCDEHATATCPNPSCVRRGSAAGRRSPDTSEACSGSGTFAGLRSRGRSAWRGCRPSALRRRPATTGSGGQRRARPGRSGQGDRGRNARNPRGRDCAHYRSPAVAKQAEFVRWQRKKMAATAPSEERHSGQVRQAGEWSDEKRWLIRRTDAVRFPGQISTKPMKQNSGNDASCGLATAIAPPRGAAWAGVTAGRRLASTTS